MGTHAASPVAVDWLEAVLFGRIAGTLWPADAQERARRIADALGIKLDAPPHTKSRRGRPPRPRSFYESIARDYRRWSGENPAKRIAEEHSVPERTARTWIYTARHRHGLLPKTQHGKASLFTRRSR
ncbi:MAG: hypothetical protein HY317_03225 [Acidobacteria bacterium]|nr:hypothetical protein [Acidobacteriota bacterium]